jgi:hypothetical protein
MTSFPSFAVPILDDPGLGGVLVLAAVLWLAAIL